MQGYNDDLVMSLCIALWVRDTALRFRSENIETQKVYLIIWEVQLTWMLVKIIVKMDLNQIHMK